MAKEEKNLSRRERLIQQRKEKASKGLDGADVFMKMSEATREQVKLPRDETYHRLFTGVLPLDLTGVGTIGRRIQVIGKPNVGKSLLLYLLGGAAQRTCRICYTPIIPWINDWEVYQKDPKEWAKRLETLDFEKKVTCACGENDHMRVLLMDIEDCYDRYWSSVWGMQAHVVSQIGGGGENPMDIPAEGKAHTLYLCKPEESAAFEDSILPLIESGAIDLTLIDSIAALAMEEDVEGYAKIASRARFLKRVLPLMLSMQLKARTKYGTRCTMAMTNHYTSGPTANPRANPNSATGGWALKYLKDIDVEIVSSRNNQAIPDGHKLKTIMKDITFKMTKSKVNQGNRSGTYRMFLDDYQRSSNIAYRAGETNEPETLLQALKELGDDRLFHPVTKGKTKTGYFLLGRVFKRVKDMALFLKRRDVQYQLRPLIAAALNEVSVTERMHLDIESYDYNPFPEYMQEQIREREKEIGEHFFKVRVSEWHRRRDAGEEV